MYNMIPFTTRRNLVHGNPFSDGFIRAFFGDNPADCLLGAERAMQVDVRDEGDRYVVQADVPGFHKDELHADVRDGVLTITAERKQTEEKQEEQGRYLYRERRYGKASRSFNLENIREEDITAEVNDGVLTLSLPKVQEPEKESVRTIAIA